VDLIEQYLQATVWRITAQQPPQRITKIATMSTRVYDNVAARLTESLGLQYPAVSVTFSSNGVNAPEYKGHAPAGCVFWQEAFEGPIKTTAQDHSLCSIGVYTHNLTDAPADYEQQLGAVMSVLGELEYVRPADMPNIPVLESSQKFVIYAPLSDSEAAPDVVLLFANARQGLVITEAIQQVEGAWPTVMGRPACAVVPYAINSGRAAMSLGCCGARAYVGPLTDDVAIWAFPGPRIGEYVDRIATLSKANDVLRQFHQIRGADVDSGARPTYEQSLGRMSEGQVDGR
jgi:uncharacterized protein (DUF169 family)